MADDDRSLRHCLVPSCRSGISIMNQENSAAPSSLAPGELLRNRCAHALGTAGLALMLGVAPGSFACAQTAPVGVPDKSYPESVTSTRDGTLYVGSFNLGGVLKVGPDGKTEQLVKPGAGGSRSTLGVLADERSATLYVCSNDISGLGVPGPTDTKGAWLKTYDLKSGAPKNGSTRADNGTAASDPPRAFLRPNSITSALASRMAAFNLIFGVAE